MALRLPDAPDLGRLPSAESNRPTASIDTSPIGAGLSAFGRGLESAGSNIANVAIREKSERNTLDDARARSRWLTGKVELDEQRDNITDPAELDRHGQKYTKLRDEAAGLYGDPARAERFRLETQPQLATSAKGVNDRKYELQSDQLRATTLGELDRLRDAGIRAKTEGERVAAIDTAKEYFQKLEDEGVLSAAERQVQQRAWIQNFARGRLNMQSPEARMEALRGDVTPTQNARTAYDFFIERGWKPHQAAGIVGNLMQESGLRTHARNAGDGSDGSDSIGIAQWNSDRAARLKRFAEARGTDWRDLKTQLEFVDLELRTSEGAAGRALTNARDVREATAAIVQYERPRGSDRGAESADGWANRLRHAQTYHGTWGGGALPGRAANSDVANVLPADERQSMFEQAQRERDAEFRQAEIQRRANQDETRSLIVNDLASLEATGKGAPPDKLSREKVAATLGEAEAASWEASRNRSQKIFNALDGIEQLPEGDVERRLKQMEPTPGSPEFVEDMAAYTKARTKASRFLDARRADPALASEVFPSVRAARQSAQYDETPDGVRTIQPASAQAIVRSRLAAQSQLGITEPMAITRSESAVIARQLRLIGEENPAQMQKFMASLDRTYGEYADEVLAATMQHANVNRELSLVASDMLRKVANGALQATDAKLLQGLIDAQAMQSAMLPQSGQQTKAPDAPAPAPKRAMGRAYQEALRQTLDERQQMQDRAAATPSKTINPDHVTMLRRNPALADEFDMTYQSPGAAKKILEDLARQTGTLPK